MEMKNQMNGGNFAKKFQLKTVLQLIDSDHPGLAHKKQKSAFEQKPQQQQQQQLHT